jgi:hypothetical protein
MASDVYGVRLASLDPETRERPSSRIGNASNARTLVERLKYEDDTRMWRYTKIQGLMDGNPPWNGQKLTDLGQGHRANFNLRESEGIVEAAKTPYYDLFFEVPRFASIFFDVDGVEPHIVEAWNDAASEEYSETLADWGNLDTQVQLHQWQMIVNGVGPLFWPHYIGWHSEACKARKVLVPQETKANVDELELCVILHSYRADELEGFISRLGYDEKGQGWNRELCEQAIIDVSVREMRQTYGTENYDMYQRAIRTGDLFYGIHSSDRIYVASIFVKEFGGKISHYIITDQLLGHQAEAVSDLEEEAGYLFRRRNKFDSFSEVLCPFFFDSGPDGTWHAVKGLGPKIYDFCDISNRTFCQMLDGSVIGSGVILETADANALSETQIALVGGASVVAPGYKVVQTRIAESLDGAMVMRRELQNVLSSNTGSYRQPTGEAVRPEPTYGQAQLLSQQQTLLSKGATNRYYNNLDKWHRETLRRILDPAQSESIPGGKEALAFRARCMMREIPAEVLLARNIRKVIATRSLGYGSPTLRDITTRELVTMIPYMDEVSRNHALRARVSSLPGVGMHSVDSYFPPIEKKGVPNAHTAMAVLENNALRQPGGKALVEPMQNHSIHFDTHMKDAAAHIQEQGAPPMMQMIHLNQAGPHMDQHLQMLQGDPTRKNEVKGKRKALDQLGRYTDQLRQQLTESMGAQQRGNGAAQGAPAQGQQPPPDPSLIPKMAKVQGDLRLKAQKMQGDMALKERKQAHSEQLSDKKVASSIQRDSARAATDIAIKRRGQQQ